MMKIRRGSWLLDLMMIIIAIGLLLGCLGYPVLAGVFIVFGILLLWVV